MDGEAKIGHLQNVENIHAFAGMHYDFFVFVVVMQSCCISDCV